MRSVKKRHMRGACVCLCVCLCALPLLDLALEVYHSGHTFGHLGIEAYTPQ